MELHAAFVHCAEPRGFLNCPWLFFVLSVVQGLCKTVIQQPEVRWVGWAGMRSRYSGTFLQLHPAPLGLLTLFDIMRAAGEMPMRLLHSPSESQQRFTVIPEIKKIPVAERH
ncbi:hypothetical protein B0H14DRAFT_2687317 [Mycena olivaceomarginata]|nr:hypothetical protein B0H14DRAFT_2687317 [Mycena olivaceomarginata]